MLITEIVCITVGNPRDLPTSTVTTICILTAEISESQNVCLETEKKDISFWKKKTMCKRKVVNEPPMKMFLPGPVKMPLNNPPPPTFWIWFIAISRDNTYGLVRRFVFVLLLRLGKLRRVVEFREKKIIVITIIVYKGKRIIYPNRKLIL